MADNSDMEVMTVLPKELRLGAPPTMPQARSYLFRQQSTLSAYNPDDQIQINIPRLQRSYLRKDSYLQFRLNGQFEPDITLVKNAGGSIISEQYAPDLFLDDSGAWGMFERLEVFDYLGSTVLESIDGIPQLMSLLIDMGTDFTDPDHEGPIQHGLEQQYVANTNRSYASSYWRSTGTSPFAPVTVTTTNNTLTITQSGGVVNTITIPSGTYGAPAIFSNAIAPLLPAGFQLRDAAVPNATVLQISSPNTFTLSGTGATAFGFGATSQFLQSGEAVVGNNRGMGVPFYTGGACLVGTGVTDRKAVYDFSYQFSIPLPSFLGFLSKKMVPLHNGFTIVLTLASKYKPMFQGCKATPYLEFMGINVTDYGATNGYEYPITIQGQNTGEPSSVGTAQGSVYAPANVLVPSKFWWQLTDVNLVCQILELGPVAESMILSSNQGQPLIVHTKQMRYYRGASSKNQAEFYLPLNLNVASLTNILWFMRPDNVDNNINFQSAGLRHKNFLQRWEFQYGSTVLPQSNGIQASFMTDPVALSGNTWSTANFSIQSGYTECIAELLKSRPCVPHKGRFSRFNFYNTQYTGLGSLYFAPNTPYKTAETLFPSSLTAPPCKFACGLNTELTTGKSGDLICGLNTNGMNTQIRGYFHPQYLTSVDKLDVVVDAYAEYDAFINISPGIATTISF